MHFLRSAAQDDPIGEQSTGDKPDRDICGRGKKKRFCRQLDIPVQLDRRALCEPANVPIFLVADAG
jgi:hypothetical protein